MVTLAEVAQHAGVSASTVSYVLSGKRSISTTTRERVEQSIRQLGYHPNAGARALASSKSNIIALMVPLRTDMYVPVMMEIAIAVATTARTHGYDVLLLTGEEGPDAVRRVTGSGLADAMILMDVELDDERLPLLRGTDQPSVLIGLPADTSGLTCVDLDFKATGALCVEHLAMLGHRDIAVIGEAPESTKGTPVSPSAPSTDSAPGHGSWASGCCTGRARAVTTPWPSPSPASSTSARAPPASSCRTSRPSSPCSACCASRDVPCPRTCRWSRSVRTRSPSRPRCD